MDQNPSNQDPFPSHPRESGNIGPLSAAVVIVLLLAAGGYYFFRSLQLRHDAANAAPSSQAVASQESTDTIESDLNATQTSGADADVSNLNNAL